MTKQEEKGLDELVQGLTVKVGLVASVFGAPTDETNAALLEVFEHYLEAHGANLRTFIEDDTGRPRTFGPREREYARRRLSKRGQSIYAGATGAPDIEHASWWQLFGRFMRNERDMLRDNLSSVEWSIAPTSDPNRFLVEFLSAVRRGRFLHGYGGCGIVTPIEYGAESNSCGTVVALAKRFSGLDVVGHRGTSNADDGIKCVNWLTLVDDTLLERIGGRAAVSQAFSSSIVCHALPHGLVIQAGARPVAGDVNGPDELAPYREVAKVLKPIYSNKIELLDTLWDDDADVGYTDEWRARFFVGAKWP